MPSIPPAAVEAWAEGPLPPAGCWLQAANEITEAARIAAAIVFFMSTPPSWSVIG